MFEQYHGLKAQNPGFILLYRMGDFYELFFADAELASRELELTLTARNKADPDPVPMAGFPHHQAPAYVQRLLDGGHKIAIADQLEDPALAKGLVKRGITRLITPGMVLDPTSLDRAAHNWLVAVARDPDGRFGLAFLDASTGDLRCTTVSQAEVAANEIQRHEPREILVEPSIDDPAIHRATHGVTRSTVNAWSAQDAHRTIVATLGADAGSFGLEDGVPALRATGAVLAYARELLGGVPKNLHRLEPYAAAGFMVLDGATRRNLELFKSLLHGSRKGTLFHLIDECVTAMGSRALRDWLSYPLLDVGQIRARSGGVAGLVGDEDLRTDLRTALRGVSDIERLGARVSQGLGHPRDLAAIRRSLQAAPDVVAVARRIPALAPHVPTDDCADVCADLVRWLVDDPPITTAEGGVIAEGAHPELDAIARISLDAIGVVNRLEEEEIRKSGITSLKIRRNRQFGFYIEITKANLHKAPERYLRKQTLSTGERYITPELKELEEQILGADDRRIRLEIELFQALRDRVAAQSERLLALARKLAALDALAALADVAVARRWVRPEVMEEPVLDAVAVRHPVVEAMLTEERFVPNDVRLDVGGRQLVILTGPNMAGKSTVLRQTALLVLLAQIGSFVPADRATIGVADRIFTRVGAADDLARGQSTFMVEMAETAAILHGATRRSLVILDEIGRGTST